MKDCGGHFHGKHLKRSLDYVMNPEKTQDGRLVGAINCQVDSAFEQMKATKRKFGKVDKRQGARRRGWRRGPRSAGAFRL